MDEKWIRKILDALHGMASANWMHFGRSPALCARYDRNLRLGRHRYVDDAITCGYIDCWSLYRDLCERYPDEKKPLPLDCEDAATAHAAWLASQCFKGIHVGFVPGDKWSHAIVGVERKGKIEVVDPCRWYGMKPTTYEGARYKKLR